MVFVDLLTQVLHMLFAGLWTGSVLFVALAGVPEGGIDRLQQITRASAVVLLVTGGHMAGTAYTAGSLTGTTSGWLVLVMLGLWLVLAGLVEVAAKRYESDGPAAARPLLQAGGVVAALLLVDAGLLAAGI